MAGSLSDVKTQFRMFMCRLLVLILAVCSTAIGLFTAVFVGGPIVRSIFGIPPGFRDHFTSSAAMGQALFVQSVAVGVAFLLLGLVSAQRIGAPRLSWALWAANPITVGGGFVLYKLSYQSIRLAVHDTEYYSIGNGALLALMSPIFLAACFGGGAYLFDRCTAGIKASRRA